MSSITNDAVFVVLPEALKERYELHVHDLIVPSLRNQMVVIGIDETDGTSKAKESKSREIFANRIEPYRIGANERLLVHRDSHCSLHELKRLWHGPHFHQCSDRAMYSEFKSAAKANGSFWKDYVDSQISKFLGTKHTSDGWLQQFNELGLSNVGRKLLTQLSVESAEKCFRASAPDLAGKKIQFCYVSDDDAGGSWIEVKSELEHIHDASRVSEIVWKSKQREILMPSLADDIDEIVICEDGLWSGIETTRRLEAIKESRFTRKIKLRFAIVTDFGLRIARHTIRDVGLEPIVEIDTSCSKYIGLLQSDLPKDLERGEAFSMRDYFVRLSAHVLCSAFREDSGVWKDQGEMVAAKDACKRIGQQLVSNWEGDISDPRRSIVDKFALGGGGFASTIVFRRSVPKVCLPVFWLDGRIEYDGKVKLWRPLFTDVRRVGNVDLLLS